MGPVGWTPRTSVELIIEQLQSIDAWVHDQGRPSPGGEPTPGGARPELRRDATRHGNTRRVTHERMLDRAQVQLGLSGGPLWADSTCRALLMHRDALWRTQLADCLAGRGVDVVAGVADGTDAVGTLVVEQPDLLVVQDLPASGLQVVGQARRYAPNTLIAVHLLDPGQAPAFLAAGATVTFTHHARPADVAQQLVASLGNHSRKTSRAPTGHGTGDRTLAEDWFPNG